MTYKPLVIETNMVFSMATRAKSWDDLPEVLGPGVYIIGGDRIEVLERVGREPLRRTIEIMKTKGGVYI